MRKIIFLLIFGLMISGLSTFVLADDELTHEPINPDVQGRGLVDTDVADLSSKVSELERKLNDMEREQRFNQYRVRQLDRDVSDLKRKF